MAPAALLAPVLVLCLLPGVQLASINGLVNVRAQQADAVVPPVDPEPQLRAEQRRAERQALAQQQKAELAAQSSLRIPKVALMFLTRGAMPHEAAWAAWLGAARRLVPLEQLPPGACSSNRSLTPAPRALPEAGGPGRLRRRILSEQALFSVYVHPAPDFKGYSVDSLFHGRSLRLRVKVAWGKHSEVEAMRLLLASALKHPLNQHFVFLCEKSAPLYPPTVVWAQLIAGGRSRVDACPKADPENAAHSFDRWRPEMLPVVPRDKWRKTGQWLSLTRRHAAVAVADQVVASEFEEHVPHEANEHYFGVVLAVAGLENETTCVSNAMSVEWPWRTGNMTHPVTFQADQIDADLFLKRRQNSEEWLQPPPCRDQAAIRAAEAAFVPVAADWQVGCHWPRTPAYDPGLLAGPRCTLFARKMSSFAVAQVLDTVTSCDSRLRIAPRQQCFARAAAAQQQQQQQQAASLHERKRGFQKLWW